MKSAEEYADEVFDRNRHSFIREDLIYLIRQAREEVREECAYKIAEFFGIDPDGNHDAIVFGDPWNLYESVSKLDLK